MTAQSYDVLAIGIAAVDDLVYVPAFPAANTKVPISRSARHPGGLATTAAAAVCRLGGKAAYLARFGGDELSGYMKSTLADFAVDVSHIIDDPSGQPFHSTIIVDDSGARTIFYDASRFRSLAAADLPESLIRSARVCFLDYLRDPPALDLAEKIRGVGGGRIPILADIEGRSASVLPLLPLIDHLIVSEEFARWASGESDLSAACRQLAQSPRAATVVTAGAQGCYLATSPAALPVHIPAFAIDAVDTTGCGDTFHGAFALAIARNFSPEQAAIFAAAAAALKATGRGGWVAIPTARDTLGLLRERLPANSQTASLLHSVDGLVS